MTVWTTISNALVAVGAKPFATTVQALRDNVLAAFEGSVGAPRLLDAALDTGAATSAGGTWVADRVSLGAALAVGTYVLASNTAVAVATHAAGATIAGSALLACNLRGDTAGAALSGSWRSMGRHETNTTAAIPLGDGRRATLFLRIS